MNRRPPSQRAGATRARRGGLARRSGRAAEVRAAVWLMACGWRIVGFRVKSAGAEIDLLARKRHVLAVIEVKSRSQLSDALAAVSADQRRRLRRAGAALVARPGFAGLSVRLDLLALAPRRLPRHIPDAWPNDA